MSKLDKLQQEKASRPRTDLLPVRALLAGAEALGFGVVKHGLHENGWGSYLEPTDKQPPGTQQDDPRTHYGSLLRHLFAWRRGEWIDPDSGEHQLPHLACAVAQVLILADLELRQREAAVEPEPEWQGRDRSPPSRYQVQLSSGEFVAATWSSRYQTFIASNGEEIRTWMRWRSA